MKFVDGNIKLSDNQDENYIEIDNEDFFLSYLNADFKSNKGASSNLFILHDPNGDTEDRVIKICKTPLNPAARTQDKRITRFKREIKAFTLVKKYNLSGVVIFFGNGEVEIADQTFLFIILEKADNDLANYLEKNNFKFSLNQKLSFCVSILNGIKQLHDKGIYHRDIKHDNILIVNNEFKIADLGLVQFREKDSDIDSANEKIGPIGWLSPEATNKMLTKNKKIGNIYDCDINYKSDIFQLGKLFWYIFQGNLPLGQLILNDKKSGESDIFEIIFLMLQYDKQRRPEIDQINLLFDPIKIRLAV
ncbi:protein kinase family protein [Flavobacterium johnsoniae]|uniref:protein kinase family protein n=1 Tax=Flavobacterium johnsoniae TaxID=986 RepID=UPI0025B0DA13|nr:protein kinase family protein [Flavobacterium johnsoniae]WJS93390.1 protein kinase family protein [Flavobacterium johnsoniae]